MGIEIDKIEEILDSFKDKNILVFGDIMLDHYLYGDIDRISPEAPVPVIKFKKESNFLGGAGNVANNLSSLGAKVSLFSVVGEDSNKDLLIKLLNEKSINTEGIITDPNRPTIVKKRIVSGNNQQVIRIDQEETSRISEFLEKQTLYVFQSKIQEANAIVVSDYAKGFITPFLMKEIINLSNRYNIPVIVDPKPSNIELYKGVTLITPNLKEAREIAKIASDSSIEQIGKEIVRRYECNLFITQGENGITLFEKNYEITHFPAKKVKVFDLTGAGDTVVAISALGLASGLNLKQIIPLANLAAGLVVQKPGTSVLTLEEIKEYLSFSNINSTRKKVDKEWGYEDWIVNYDKWNFCGKRLVLKKKYQCSIHHHKDKNEVFYINKGIVLMKLDEKELLMKEGDSILIEPFTNHRFIGLTDAEIIEFSTHHKDEDSYREEPSGQVDNMVFEGYLKKYLNGINEEK